ncbi:MAG: response regulator [Cyclobacteriaceae bacterium]
MMRYWIVIAMVVMSIMSIAAEKIVFHQLPYRLSQNTVTTILQDNNGFLWFGTLYGLNRYNARGFDIFLHNSQDSTSLNSNRIANGVKDQEGNFWLATSNGLAFMNTQTGKFKQYIHEPNNPNSLSNNEGTAVYLDHKGMVWFGTEDGGLNMLNPKTNNVTRYLNNLDDPYSINDNHVTSISEDLQGNLWIGTMNNGINLFDRNNQRFIGYHMSNGLTNSSIRTLHKGKSSLYVGSQNGVYQLKYDPTGKYLFEKPGILNSKELEGAFVLSLLEDSSGKLWIGTENKGLFVVDFQSGTISNHLADFSGELNMSSKSIWSLQEDYTGIIWIGTFINGVVKADPYHRKFNHIKVHPERQNTLSYNVVSAFSETSDGKLWIGTDGGGLNLYNPTKDSYQIFTNDETDANSLSSDAVTSLLLDKNENLWIGTWRGGISILPKGSNRFIQKMPNGQDPNAPLSADAMYLTQDSQQNIWVMEYRNGIGIYNPNDFSKIKYYKGLIDGGPLSSNKNRFMREVSPGKIWIGSEDFGIQVISIDESYNIISNKKFNHDKNDPNSLSHDMVSAIHKDQSGNIWVATFGGGINIYDSATESFSRIQVKDGLSSDLVFSIEEDIKGNIWVSTGNGLSKISSDLSIQQFDEKDGLQGPEFFRASSYVGADGKFYFGGVNGYNLFNPNDLVENTNVPLVHITNFKVQGSPEKSVSNILISQTFPSGTIDLDYDENDLVFSFAVLNYSQVSKNRYTYMLDNYDDVWQTSPNGSNISYSNLSPGFYTFHVKGANNDGVWNEKGDSIRITIARPWYGSSLAYSFYSLIIVGILIWYRQTLINKERLKSELQVEHLQLTKMQEVNELKSTFFANISHEFRTPLTLILGPLKALINGTFKGDPRSQYRVMLRNADRLLRLINQILELAKLEAGSMKLQASNDDIVKFLKPLAHSFTSYAERQFIDYKCVFPDEKVDIYFEKDKLEKIVVNLISNAFKYTPEFGKITLEVVDESDTLNIIIADSGVGIQSDQLEHIFNRFYQVGNQKQKGTGIGLALTKELVDLHHGNIRVESEMGKGTRFTVSLKKGQQHLDEDEIVTSDAHTLRLKSEDYNEMEIINDSNRDVPNEFTEDTNEQKIADDLPIVLVAEDNEDMRNFISEYLVTNYKVIEADNGVQALELANEHIPDILITDVMMPEMDGYELCQNIKNDDRTSHIPVILLTAKASSESTEKGFELGADYYVTKPFNPKLLELRIKNILKTRDQIRGQLMTSDQVEVSLEPRDLQIASKDQEFLKRVIQCVEDNMANSDFGVDDICRELGLSRTQLYRKLKGLVGQSANEFVRSFRMKRAAQLLKKQELTISEVTYQVGFNDLQYFRYCFKKQFGVNPSEYAQM